MDTLPSPPLRSHPRLLRGLMQTPESVLPELMATVGPLCRLGGPPLRFVIVGEPTTVRELLLEPSDRFRWDHPLMPFRFAIGETTMLGSSGDDHRRRRGAVQEAFSRRRLDRWVPMIVEQTDGAIEQLLEEGSSGAPVDIAPWAKRLVIEIVVRALFGDRLVDRTGEIEQRFQRIQDYLGGPLWGQTPHPFPFGSRAAVKRDRAALDDLIDGEIARARRATEHDPYDILAVLVDRGELTDAEIRDQVKTLIGAGYDTTSSSMAWLTSEATRCDGLWRRLRSEAAKVFDGDGDVRLPSFDLAARTVRETLRLHPGSGIGARITAETVHVGGYDIPRNTIVAWSPYLTGRHPGTFANPDRFDPDRWLVADEAARAAGDLAWMPFGRGPRSCIGFGLAQMQLTLILVRLALRVDLTPTSLDCPTAQGLIVSRPHGGAPMIVSAAAARRDAGL